MYQFFVATSVMPHQTRRKIHWTTLFSAEVEREQIDAEEHRRQDHDDRRRVDLLLRRPGDALQLVAHLARGTAARARTGRRPPPSTLSSRRRVRQSVLTRAIVSTRPRSRRLRSNGSGRPGGNRTPNPRFWRPVLCQLSYWPTSAIARVDATR